MSLSRSPEPISFHPLRICWRMARSGDRKVRAARNRLLNLADPPRVILVYHRVTDLVCDPEMLAVSPGNFRLQMEYLKRNFRLVRFEEDWSGHHQPAVAVTFDDGYADNVREALPILEEVGVPATFFVSTGRIGTDKVFWWHELESLLLRHGEFPSRFELNDCRFRRVWETASPAQRRALYASVNLLMQRIGPDRQEAWLAQLREWAGTGGGGKGIHRSMTQGELQKLAASSWVTIGAHSVSHSALAALTEDQQRYEIFTSKKDLETLIGAEITIFSYPFGRKSDYNRTSVRLCRQAGFLKAAANFPGQVHRWTDPWQLPRHLVRNWDIDTFVAEMEGFWTR